MFNMSQQFKLKPKGLLHLSLKTGSWDFQFQEGGQKACLEFIRRRLHSSLIKGSWPMASIKIICLCPSNGQGHVFQFPFDRKHEFTRTKSQQVAGLLAVCQGGHDTKQFSPSLALNLTSKSNSITHFSGFFLKKHKEGTQPHKIQGN